MHAVFEQEAVYGECVRPLVDSLFRGINATVLAYGQTGLHVKTHLPLDAQRWLAVAHASCTSLIAERK